ncbi:MAG: hypothetical protein PHQ42_02155 [Patescibacteria group bacterium]|nr:hypothetical protein [Patescibacteria group bacterium]
MEKFSWVRKNLFIIAVFILVLIVGLSIGWFLGRSKGEGNFDAGQSFIGGQRAAQEDEILEKDGFSVLLPKGWQEAGAPTGVSAMVVNAGEEITDPALERINFRSYYTVSYDTLGERTVEDYIGYIKEMVKQFAPEIIFTSEGNLKIRDRDAYKLEADLNQSGASFKVLIFLIRGEDDDIWNMSFNSGIFNWEKNREEFGKIADSFSVK